MTSHLFPQKKEITPQIYAYSTNDPAEKNLLKIGYTERAHIRERIDEQLKNTKRPATYKIDFSASAVRSDGTLFSDHDIHKYLTKRNFKNPIGEWFEISVEDLKAAYIAVKERRINLENRTENFSMRPEQKDAVTKTAHFFRNAFKDKTYHKSPRFLWNAKMRFGKTFTTYQLAKEMGWTKLLVLTFKPAVQAAWENDLKTHIDFEGWQFFSREDNRENLNPKKPLVCFGSFQDFLGTTKEGGIKAKNEWVHALNWDCVIFDEYHFGAWRENAKELFDDKNESEQPKNFDQDILPITSNAYLYLSGTPFRALHSGEFIEDQIYNWTYSDEQSARENWQGDTANPYASLPRMIMMTYQLPQEIQEIALEGEFNEFDLSRFFSAEGERENASFIHQEYVQKWLNLIRGGLKETYKDDLKLGKNKPKMPFSDKELLPLLSHTFWFLPNIAACNAMENLLKQPQNKFYHDYEIINIAGNNVGTGVKALPPLYHAMEKQGDCLNTKTITLSCGKLTTGITIRQWSGIFMLRNLQSPETYFQAAFRIQSPWVIKETILKETCYIFDFAPHRALRQLTDYGSQLNIEENNLEKRLEEFIRFLPVLSYEDGTMTQLNIRDILEKTISGTTASLLARGWQSPLLVNVDNTTLQRLIDNPEAITALMSLDSFRTIKNDIVTILNKTPSINEKKKDSTERELTETEKKELSQEEKEIKSLRKEIQEKLIKFATRVPIFMYLTDDRENSLTDIITQLEPEFFQRITGLKVSDFDLLVRLEVFNKEPMNHAIYNFKRYEDHSLEYTGLNLHDEETYIGGFDERKSRQEIYAH